jgi:hypothetical protein
MREVIKEELDLIKDEIRSEIRSELNHLKVRSKMPKTKGLWPDSPPTEITDAIKGAVALFTQHEGKQPTMLNIGQNTWNCLRKEYENREVHTLSSCDKFMDMKIFITSHFEGFTICELK